MKLVVFGEAERGEWHTPLHITNRADLFSRFGHPPPETRGIQSAIEAILYGHTVIYLRVREEGFSTSDYMQGCDYLASAPSIKAACLPGVGSPDILARVRSVARIILTSQRDLFDYFTSLK